MVSLDLSFKELLRFLRSNIKKWPKLLDNLTCRGNRLNFDIPRKKNGNEVYPPIPVEGTLDLDNARFILVAGSGEINRVASLVFTSEELVRVLRKNLKRWPALLENLEYDQRHNIFHLTIKPNEPKTGEKPAFHPAVNVLSRLFSPGEGQLRLRVTTE